MRPLDLGPCGEHILQLLDPIEQIPTFKFACHFKGKSNRSQGDMQHFRNILGLIWPTHGWSMGVTLRTPTIRLRPTSPWFLPLNFASRAKKEASLYNISGHIPQKCHCPKLSLPSPSLHIAHLHLLVPGHQRTVSTSKSCNQWLSLAKTLLKVALVGGNRSLVACTSKCGQANTRKLYLGWYVDDDVRRGDILGLNGTLHSRNTSGVS